MVKTITVTDEAYAHLKQMKNDEESFSKLIERLYHPDKKTDLRDFLGILNKEEAEELRQIVKETRKTLDTNLKGRAKRMGL